MHILLLFPLLLMVSPNDLAIYKFDKQSDPSEWQIIDDGVMGGLSQGTMNISGEGYGKFSGKVRLENNGGFSSVRYQPEALEVTDETKIKVRLKGDGKKYQFRVRSNFQEYHSYIYNFQTSGEWEVIEINLDDMYPSWRGRRLNMDNFSTGPIAEIGFLIGNKKAESFELLIDYIKLD